MSNSMEVIVLNDVSLDVVFRQILTFAEDSVAVVLGLKKSFNQ